MVEKFATGVADTGGKFATVVVDTGGKLPPVSLTPVVNLPPVSLIPVVHLDSRISPWILEKIRNGLLGILWGWGQTDSWKKQKKKISWQSPFNVVYKKKLNAHLWK